MSRTKQLQTRPELPSLEEILKDLESSPNDDVAFTFLRNDTSGTSEIIQGINIMDEHLGGGATSISGEAADTSKSFESAAKRPRQEMNKTAGSGKHQHTEQSRKNTEKDDVQDCYLKVLKFLEMNSYLKDSQDKLTQQCSDLQELGQSVKDQIESLRTQLHS